MSILKIQKNISNPFRLEEYRAQLAFIKNLKKLKETYDQNFPSIQNRNTQKLWDQLNDETGELLANGRNPMADHRAKIVAQQILSGHAVLDVGFGSACIEALLVNKNIQVTGIDFSTESVRSARIKYPNWNFDTLDITKPWRLKLLNKPVDYIVALEVLEHINPNKLFHVLNEFYRHLKKNGILIISVPLNEGLEDMVNRNYNPNEHVRVYTPELINAELKIAGFIVRKQYTLFAFNSLYKLKTFVSKYLQVNKRKPNNIILVAQKV